MLLFGRITYELMAGYWPAPLALKNDPVIAERMNTLPKVVFSRTLDQALWQNTTLVKSDMVAAVCKMKAEPGHDDAMVILGSGSVVSQLARESLIDVYQLVLNPVVLGRGRTLFDGIRNKLRLKLTQSRSFANGSVFLSFSGG
jgi:dihydrofolate reductase